MHPGPSRTQWEFSPSQNERVFTFLLQLSHEVQSLLDLPRLLGKIVEVLDEVKHYHHCLVYLKEEAGVVAAEAVGHRAFQKGYRQSADGGPIGWALQNAQLSVDPIAGPDLSLREDGSDPRRARIVMPLVADGRTLGALEVESEPGTPFTEEDNVFLELLAPYISTLLAVAQAHEQTHQDALRDWLTGMYNYRHFQERSEEELSRARRYQHPLTIGLLDVDNLKEVNDTHGHLAGDQVLRIVARTLRQGLRSSDVVARYGGDEFSIIMVETGLATATAVAERVVGLVDKETFAVGGAHYPVPRLSWGLAAFPEDADNTTTLFEVADRRLYAAKRAKRAGIIPPKTPPTS